MKNLLYIILIFNIVSCNSNKKQKSKNDLLKTSNLSNFKNTELMIKDEN